MKIIVENTDKVVTLVVNGVEVPARVWQGQTATGTPIHCYITRIAVAEGQPAEVYQDFERNLQQTAKMRPDIQGIPLRLIL